MALKKGDIVKSIQDQLNLPKDKSAGLVESVLESITQSLADGEDVAISGFGKFCVIDKKARSGRNPQTGEPIVIGPRRVVTFRNSSRLKEKLNSE